MSFRVGEELEIRVAIPQTFSACERSIKSLFAVPSKCIRCRSRSAGRCGSRQCVEIMPTRRPPREISGVDCTARMRVWLAVQRGRPNMDLPARSINRFRGLCILWHSLINFAGNVADRSYRTELGNFMVLTCFLDVEPRANQSLELQNFGEFFF